jgi:excisionase family DNA binding protein
MNELVPSPWMNSTTAAAYLQRGRRFVLKEIHAGRLRAATVGGRREILTRREWCDAWVDAQARPVLVRSTRMLG